MKKLYLFMGLGLFLALSLVVLGGGDGDAVLGTYLFLTVGPSILYLSCYLFFLPTVVSNRRNHHKVGTILIMNLCAGWTGIFWLVALIWAYRGKPYKPEIIERKDGVYLE